MDIQSLEQEGWKYLKSKDFDKALETFNEIYSLEPENVAGLQGRIACYRKKRDFKKASTLLEKALLIYPDKSAILSEKAWYHLEQNEYDEAIKAFKDLLTVQNDDPSIFLWQSYLLRRQRKYLEALNLIKEAIALFPDDLSIAIEKGWITFYQFQFEECIQIFNNILEKKPLHELALQGKIASLRMLRDYSEALNLCNKAIKELQKSPGLHSERAWINMEIGNFDEAVEDFNIVLTLVNNDEYAHINLAWALIKQFSTGSLDKAAYHCRCALDIRPELSEAFSCLGNLSFKKGNIREAESYFLRSIKSDSVRGSHVDLAALYIQMERYEEAKEHLDQAIKNNSEDAYAHLEMGYLYLHTDKTKEATREFRIATIMDPNNPESYKALAVALTENNNLIEAEKVLRKAIKIFNEDKRSQLHLALSQLLTLLGDQTNNSSFYNDALKEVQNAIRINPDDASFYFYSGIIRFKLEDYKNSLSNFNKCLKQDEKYLEAELNLKRVKEQMHNKKTLIRSSQFSSIFLTSIFLVQLVFIWVLYFENEIEPVMISVLVPILCGLLIISVLLPWLSRFKLSGIEAELNDPRPKESLPSGPKGEMILSSNFKKMY